MNEEKEKENQTRCKIMYVPWDFLLSVLRQFNGSEFIACPSFPDLPESCEIVSVHSCFSRRSFAVIIRDASFEKANPTMELPEMKISGNLVYTTIAEKETV